MKKHWKIGFLILMAINAVFSERVIPDMFPLAVGNYWKFSIKAGGTMTYTITETINDTFACTHQTSSSGFIYSDTFKFVSFDSLGYFNHPLYRDLTSGIWGPHCALVQNRSIRTDAGIFDTTYAYPVTWGHPSGGNRNMVLAAGVGPVVIAYSQLTCDAPPCLDTFAYLSSYHVNKIPEAVWFENSGLAQNDTSFLFSYFKGDSGLVEFNIDKGGCEKYMISSSFNSATDVLRIYMVDTTKSFCNELAPMRKALKIRNLSEGKTYTIKIYQSYFDDSINVIKDISYDLKTYLLYSRKIACDNASMNKNQYSKNLELVMKRSSVFNIQGRLVANFHNQFRTSGNKFNCQAGSGVYIIKNGNEFRTFNYLKDK